MRVVTHVGSRAGEVVDLPPRSAWAMVADGRASWPSDTVADASSPPVAVQVDHRTDRAMPRHKRREKR